MTYAIMFVPLCPRANLPRSNKFINRARNQVSQYLACVQASIQVEGGVGGREGAEELATSNDAGEQGEEEEHGLKS